MPSRHRFDQRDPGLFFGGCIVTHTTWNHKKLTRPNQHRATIPISTADARLVEMKRLIEQTTLMYWSLTRPTTFGEQNSLRPAQANSSETGVVCGLAAKASSVISLASAFEDIALQPCGNQPD